MPIIDDILEEHALEAAGLWSLRHAMVQRAHVRLPDLAAHDERIEAHLDGLRLGGDDGWRIAQQVMEADPGAPSAFALAALVTETSAAIPAETRRAALAAFALADPTVAPGIVRGSTWRDPSRSASLSGAWWQAEEPILRQLALGIDVASRRDPGAQLTSACTHVDASLRARALRAVGEVGRGDLGERCRRAVSDLDPHCRGAAVWSSALLGGEVTVALRSLATAGSSWEDRLVALAARRLPRATVMEWLTSEGRRPALLRRAIRLAAFHGDTLVMPWLLLHLPKPAFARCAGEAFTFLTGVDLEEAGLVTGKPNGFRSGPSDDPADDDVAQDPDEDLPWPDATKVTAWWTQRSADFPPGVRRLLGQSLTPAHLEHVLRAGTQPQRAAAAIERALLAPGQWLFDVTAPADQQMVLLAPASAANATP